MKNNLLEKIGNFITKYRYIIMVLFLIVFTFCMYNFNNVKINNDITTYLPDNTETKYSLNLMNKEYGTFTTLSLMVEDTDESKSRLIYEKIDKIIEIKNVSYVMKDDNALYTIQLVDVTDDMMVDVIYNVKKIVKDETYHIHSTYYNKALNGIDIIVILSIIIILFIILINCRSYFEIVITSIIFLVTIVLNMGTNFIVGEISYITESITIILQLALSIDYVIIFMNRFTEEINDKSKLLVIKNTLTKSIKEIFASSLTTISGLLALLFMQLKIGKDVGIVLSKGIICSLITVIFLMPSILSIFYKVIIKTTKKRKEKNNFKFGEIIINSRKVILPIFIFLVLLSIFMIPNYKFVYNPNTTKAIYLDSNAKALEKIESVFGKSNTLAVIVRNEEKDYSKELLVANKLNELEEVTLVTSVGSYEISKGVYFTSEVNYKELKEVLKRFIVLDESLLKEIYIFYIDKNNIKIDNIEEYKIKLIDLVYFLKKYEKEINVSGEVRFRLDVMYARMSDSISLLESDNYTRFIINLDLPIEGKNVEKVIEKIRNISEEYYDEVTLAGNSVSSIDLEETFKKDNVIITFVTIIFIFIILLSLFKSVLLSLLLILTIEGSILINFGLSVIFGYEIFFISYLIVIAIQMGATIDYAIVIANRYLELKDNYSKKESIILALKDRIKTILTSGFILMISGFLVGFISPSSVISSIGIFLGIGTLISLISTIFVLPCILYIIDINKLKRNTK